MKHPFLNQSDVSVFDGSRSGKKVRAERYDEPGAEHPTEGDITDPTVRHRRRAHVLTASTDGDWSWKPHRYPQDPGYVLTREEIDAWVAAGTPRLRQETPARIAQLEEQMSTFRGVPKGAAELYGPRIRN